MSDLEITVDEVKRLLDEVPGGVLLVDVRRDDERAICTLDGAMHVPMERVAQAADDVADEADGREVVVYCHHGVRSLTAVNLLRAGGVVRARSMRGGIDDWSRRIDPGVPTY